MSDSKLGYAMPGANYVGLTGISDLSDKLRTLHDSPGSSGNVDVGGIEITIPIDHVLDYNDFVTKMQHDTKFEKMVMAMTVDKLGGGIRHDKYKYSWKK